MNALRLSILLTLPLTISGCASIWPFGGTSVKPIEIQTKAVERTKLDIPEQKPLTARVPQWYIITPENADQIFAELKEKNIDVVLFALTDEGYEQLALNMAEIRNYISSQRTIILKYKEYYEPAKSDPSK